MYLFFSRSGGFFGRCTVTLALLITFHNTSLYSQLLSPAPPEVVGISSSKLALANDHVNAYVSSEALPGGVFLLARRGKIVWYEAYGSRSLSKTEAYKKDDLFRLASMTKAVTSVAILQLVEQGKLGLDDPVHMYIPAFKSSQILDTFNAQDSSYTTTPVKTPITIRHLLTHTSGITYGDNNPGKILAIYTKHNLDGSGLYHESLNLEAFVNRLAEVPLVFEPGTRFLYGLNMDILGRVVEVISGMELDEYFESQIFGPLGMTETYFHVPPGIHDRIVPVYSYNEDGSMMMIEPGGPAGNPDYPKLADNGHYAGGGGLTGTTMDYARFIQALLNNGQYNGAQILSRNAIETMTSDQLIAQNKSGQGFSDIPGITFCLGFALLNPEAAGRSFKSPGTYEWGGYFNTSFFIDPEEDLIFVGMTQIVPFQRPDFWDRLISIIYSSISD